MLPICTVVVSNIDWALVCDVFGILKIMVAHIFRNLFEDTFIEIMNKIRKQNSTCRKLY